MIVYFNQQHTHCQVVVSRFRTLGTRSQAGIVQPCFGQKVIHILPVRIPLPRRNYRKTQVNAFLILLCSPR